MADVVKEISVFEEKKLKIMTWNINGIRAVTRGKSLKKFLDELDADIICFQETKITRDMLEESICIVEGYNGYFSFSRLKTGYSGVATFCRDCTTPCAAEEGLTSTWTDEPTIGCYGNTQCFTSDQLTSLDKEGRAVLTEHELNNGEKLVIINTYCPRADLENEERMEFKMQYYKLLQIRVEALLESGRHVIVLGDLNVAHKPIDHCEPGDLKIYNAYPSRVWMNQFVKKIMVRTTAPDDPVNKQLNRDHSNKQNKQIAQNNDLASKQEREVSLEGTLVDSLRFIHLNQKDAYTNWCTSTGARQTNYGKRLDYILGDILLIKEKFVDCIIRPEIEGSDHCPVVALLSAEIVPSKRPPALCAKFMPEFSGKQQKLASYFIKKTIKEKNASKTVTTQVKRSNNFGAIPQAKRVKTQAQPRQQNSLFNFFGKKPNAASSDTAGKQGRDSLPSSGSSTITNSDPQKNSQHTFGPSSTFPENLSQTSEAFPKTVDQHRKAEVSVWKNILKGPTPPPLCPGHNEPCVLRTVKKKGPNCGRQFFCCARPEGHISNKEARCKFFKWTK